MEATGRPEAKVPEPEERGYPRDDDLYQLFVRLDGIEPLIWRRLLVSKQTGLPRLHLILQELMGWLDYHLHRFEVGDGVAFAMPSVEDFSPLPIDYRLLTLDQIAPQEGACFRCVYDYGDDWIHEITVENRRRPVPGHRYPVVLEGRRATQPKMSVDHTAIRTYWRSFRIPNIGSTSGTESGPVPGSIPSDLTWRR